MRAPIIRRHVQTRPPQRDEPDMRSTPHNVTSSTIAIRACFQPVQAPEKSALAGQTSPYPAAFVWLGGVLFCRPFGGVPAGRKHTRAERIEN